MRVARDDGSGPEGAARSARYRALEDTAERLGAAAVLIGHTRDDQAEQVLLGLARGSGSRSLSGMPRRRGLFVRPFIALGRSETEAACAAYEIEPWRDPHNEDPTFARVRARGFLRALEDELGPGDRRGARPQRRDAARGRGLPRGRGARRAAHPGRRAVVGHGAPGVAPSAAHPGLAVAGSRSRVGAGQLTAAHVESLDALLTSWHGQGPLTCPDTCGPAAAATW